MKSTQFLLVLEFLTCASIVHAQFCPASGLSKLYCDEASNLIEFTTKNGERFDAITSQFPPYDSIKVLRLRGVRFPDDRVTKGLLDKFRSLTELVLINCNIQKIDDDALRAQSDTLQKLEVSGNKNLEFIGTQSLSNLLQLKISGSKMKKLPEIKAPSLRELFFDGSSVFSRLNGDGMKEYSSLTKVVLNGLKIPRVELSDVTSMPTSIQELILTGCGIDYIAPGAFSPLNRLQKLNIGSNNLNATSLQNALLGLTSLKQLLGSGLKNLRNPAANLLDSIRSSVESVDFSNCPLQSLPANFFADMPRLNVVKLRSTELSSIAVEAFNNSKSVKHLDCSNNLLSARDLSALPISLSYLDLSDNQDLFRNIALRIQHFADQFKMLVTLRMRNCSLQRIEDTAFQGMNFLEELVLAVNKLDQFPTALCRQSSATSLQKLDLSSQQTDSPQSHFKMPDDRCSGLQEITTLNLANLTIDAADLSSKFWRDWPRLLELDLSNNRLDSLLLPAADSEQKTRLVDFLELLGTSSQLQKLMLASSNISGRLDIGLVCSARPTLTEFVLNSNYIESVVGTVGSCERLRVLKLRSNSITSFLQPINVFCAMLSLTALDVSNNPFDCNCELASSWSRSQGANSEFGSQLCGSQLNKPPPKCKVAGAFVTITEYGSSCPMSADPSTDFETCISAKKRLSRVPNRPRQKELGISLVDGSERVETIPVANTLKAEAVSETEKADSSNYPGIVGGGVAIAVAVGLSLLGWKQRDRVHGVIHRLRYRNRNRYRAPRDLLVPNFDSSDDSFHTLGTRTTNFGQESSEADDSTWTSIPLNDLSSTIPEERVENEDRPCNPDNSYASVSLSPSANAEVRRNEPAGHAISQSVLVEVNEDADADAEPIRKSVGDDDEITVMKWIE